ncbi:MAG: hypothetical protein HYY16_01110 [Planctomycetes bacterium]|nr:hypothetical protein [Planctomycetota bacterium]
MDNAQIAATLELFGNLLDLLGENAFKVRAYHAAARTLEGLERAVASLVREGKLKDVPGVGEGLAQKIEELLATGKIKQLEELKQKVPAGVLDLLRIPGCGPKRVRTLWEKLAIVDLALLKKACVEGKVAELPGFGERTQTKILQGIEFVASSSGRFRLDQVMPVARHVLEYVRGSKEVVRSHLAGSMRRWKEIVRNVDIVASTRNPEHVIDRFSRYEQVQSILGKGPTKCSVQLISGIQIDLRVVKAEAYFPALVYFTGSKDHNVLLRTRAQKMGLLVNEYGIFKGDKRLKVASEAELYQRLGLGMVPPELREAHGEIEAAESGVLPDLVELDDVVGMFHVHSTWSDGTAEIADMAEKCRKMGFKYMGL